MARQTAQDMVEQIRLSAGSETSETLTDTQILRQVNNAYLELASKYPFPELLTNTSFNTVASTATQTLPSDVMKVTDVSNDTGGFDMRAMSPHEYTRYGNDTTTGEPIYYFIATQSSGDKVMYLWPTPDAVYTIDYWYKTEPTHLVLDPSPTSPVIGEQWDDVIVHKATARVCRTLGAMQKSYQWNGATREIEEAAAKSSFVVSEIPIYPTSAVGKAVRSL